MESTSNLSARRYDLDWMRVIMILIVFIFHSGRFFDTFDWHVKNNSTYAFMDTWIAFLVCFLMPAIFVISGASLYLSLKPGKGGKFILDKVFRLLVPLVVGIFTHVTVGVYLERLTYHQFSGSFIDFFPHYFEGLYTEGGNFAWMGLHLWYLLILFVFSIAFLPIFTILKNQGRSFLQILGDFSSLPGMIFLLAIPIILLNIHVNPFTTLGERNWGGWGLVEYIPFFFYGFLIISNQRLQDIIRRQRWITFFLVIISSFLLILTNLKYPQPRFGSTGYTLLYGSIALNGWLWILLLFGFGFQHLNVKSRFIAHASEATMPFYILHQTVLLIVGYFITDLQIPDLAKFGLIFITSFSVIFLLVEIIMQFDLLRVLFGMKLRKKAGLQPVQSASQAKIAFGK